MNTEFKTFTAAVTGNARMDELHDIVMNETLRMSERVAALAEMDQIMGNVEVMIADAAGVRDYVIDNSF